MYSDCGVGALSWYHFEVVLGFWVCRVGDTYPHNMLEVHMRAYFYKWHPRVTLEGDVLPFEVSSSRLEEKSPSQSCSKHL